tara:strand:+ start:430 stop:558 length:129 start_codon:yes stop_codon:yes gene_type:complete
LLFPLNKGVSLFSSPVNIRLPLSKKIFGMLNEDIKDFAEVEK